jgi:hypothetical protein
MNNPAHPGRIVRTARLEPLGLSIAEGAKNPGVAQQMLNNFINGESGIDLGYLGQKQFCHIRVALFRRPMQRRIAVVVPTADGFQASIRTRTTDLS